MSNTAVAQKYDPDRRIKNTFAPNCKNEYFVPSTLASLCRFGFSYDKLPDEAKEMVNGFWDELRRREEVSKAAIAAGRPDPYAPAPKPKTIKNTFWDLPRKELTAGQIVTLCWQGYPPEQLTDEARQMAEEHIREGNATRRKKGVKELPPLDQIKGFDAGY